MAGKFDPQNAQNLVEIEKQFAVKAVEQAQTYWNLLAKVQPKELRLTKLDDEIFQHTMEAFPELAKEPYENLTKLDEEWMKSAEGKERWRKFIMSYEKKVKDHNFGSLIRMNARDEYAEKNTIFGTTLALVGFSSPLYTHMRSRSQFYAIEISRNRLGLNDKAHEMAKEEVEKERLQKEQEDAKKKKKKASS